MSDITQKVNDLRFRLLQMLPTETDLIRDFESALAEERPSLLTLEDFRHPDNRARAIADAEKQVGLIKMALQDAGSEHVPDIADSLTRAIQKRDEARALPEHEYNCWECEKVFQSAARRVLLISGSVDHDESGAVIAAMRFRVPLHLVLCPECKGKMKIREYVGIPTTPPPQVDEQREAQRAKKRIRE